MQGHAVGVWVKAMRMSKRVMAKLVVAIVALCAMTLLQGCGEDEDLAYSFIWAPSTGNATAVFMSSGGGGTW